MNKQKKIFSRREMLEMAIGLGGFAFSGTTGPVFAQEANRIFTPSLIMGPFYPQMKPLDRDADLTVIAGKKGRALGKIVHLTGRILNSKGEPVSGAKVEIWQANTHGRYSHPSDPNFQGYGAQITDAEGRYRFKTVKPGAYPGLLAGRRTPHIHFEVAGKFDRIVTQVFFPDEPLNEQDNILNSLRGTRRESVIVKMLSPAKELEPDSIVAVWDMVLLKG